MTVLFKLKINNNKSMNSFKAFRKKMPVAYFVVSNINLEYKSATEFPSPGTIELFHYA